MASKARGSKASKAARRFKASFVDNKMEGLQPEVVELTKSQDTAAGDGPTTDAEVLGALLKKCQSLLIKEKHPSLISDALHKACDNVIDILTAMADRDSLVKSASTSKVVNMYSTLLAPSALDGILSVIDPEKSEIVDFRDIKIVKKLGATVDDTHTVAAGGPTRMKNAKIAVIQFQISPPTTDTVQRLIVLFSPEKETTLKEEERNYFFGVIRRIILTGCNTLLIQQGVLSDVYLHYLAEADILVIKDLDTDEIEFVAKTLNCLPIPSIEHFSADKLGQADLVEEDSLGDGKILKITVNKDMGRTTSLVIRGSHQLVLCTIKFYHSSKFYILG